MFYTLDNSPKCGRPNPGAPSSDAGMSPLLHDHVRVLKWSLCLVVAEVLEPLGELHENYYFHGLPENPA